jgi:predicted amidophosphoribosyltransferase
MRKGSSLYLWFLISALVPLIGPLTAAVYRRETEEALRICPGCSRAVRHYDAMCMGCGTDLDYPDDSELIEPDPSIRVRAQL